MEERLNELEKILITVCSEYEDDCLKCPRNKECEEYLKLSRLIDK